MALVEGTQTSVVFPLSPDGEGEDARGAQREPSASKKRVWNEHCS